MRDDSELFISVPRKAVVLEDGTKIDVTPFAIAKYPVSIAQFSRFTEEAGYVTVAERQGDQYCFREQPSLDMIPVSKRGPLPAAFVCYHDAVAYCEWAQMRLPSEAEWLAAAVIDDDVYEDRYEARERYQELAKRPEALCSISGGEITGTLLNGRDVVVRSGPRLVRSSRSATNPRNREVVPPTYYESLQFRVCKRL